MPEGETVEGWSNYPTWAVNLWLANDRELNEEALRRVRGVRAIASQDEPAPAVAAMLKAWIEGRVPRIRAPFDSLLSYGLAEVDWYELATEWIGNAAEVPA